MGTPFATQKFNVRPDIITMAKALTNGSIPMGGVAVTDEIYDTITNSAPENAIEFFHGYTYSAHPAACAAGIATQKIYESERAFLNAQLRLRIISLMPSGRFKIIHLLPISAVLA
jgi:beta-alanine--pyruvate transaminase